MTMHYAPPRQAIPPSHPLVVLSERLYRKHGLQPVLNSTWLRVTTEHRNIYVQLRQVKVSKRWGRQRQAWLFVWGNSKERQATIDQVDLAASKIAALAREAVR